MLSSFRAYQASGIWGVGDVSTVRHAEIESEDILRKPFLALVPLYRYPLRRRRVEYDRIDFAPLPKQP